MQKNKMRILVLSVVLLFSLVAFYFLFLKPSSLEITSFEECVEAGYPVMESHPRRCSTSEGEIFIENLDLNVEEFYGSSTYYPCKVDSDCIASGCNGEICQGIEEETMASVCMLPEQALPTDLDYSCGCFEGECQWGK